MIYIDPDSGNDSWDGSRGIYISGTTGPRATMPTMASDNDYYYLRGTTSDLTARIDIQTLDNITVGAYWMNGTTEETGDSPLAKPIFTSYLTLSSTGDFTDLGGNVWVYDSGDGFTNNHFLLGLGALGTRSSPQWTERRNYLSAAGPPASSFDTFGQWDANVGAAAPNEAKLYIYSDANPVTKWGNIYVARFQRQVFRIRTNSTNITIENLKFVNAYVGVNMITGSGENNQNITVQNCEAEHCAFGITSGSTSGNETNTKILNNEFYEVGNWGIRCADEHPGLLVQGNIIDGAGGAESIGGIYGPTKGTAAAPAIFELNTVKNIYLGDYWNESYGLYMETTGTYSTYRRNYVENCQKAGLHSNSGEPFNVYHSNVVVDCIQGISDSDSNSNDNHQCSYHNNVFYNVRVGMWIGRPVGITTVDAKVYNNIFVGDGNVNSAGFQLDPEVDDLGGLDEDYNVVYNFNTNIERTSGVLLTAFGANNSTADPLLNSTYNIISNASPAYATGVRWWTTRPVGYDGEPFPDWDIDIGGSQSLFSPFHPVNL